jgi:hypothetical protein
MLKKLGSSWHEMQSKMSRSQRPPSIQTIGPIEGGDWGPFQAGAKQWLKLSRYLDKHRVKAPHS